MNFALMAFTFYLLHLGSVCGGCAQVLNSSSIYFAFF